MDENMMNKKCVLYEIRVFVKLEQCGKIAGAKFTGYRLFEMNGF